MKKNLLLFLVLTTVGVIAQGKGSISGKIMDLEMNDEPMLFANVRLKGNPNKTQTNFHGNFELENVEVGEHTLIVSYAGYEKLEIPVIVEKDKNVKVEGGLFQKTISLADIAVNKMEDQETPFKVISGLK